MMEDNPMGMAVVSCGIGKYITYGYAAKGCGMSWGSFVKGG